MHARLAQVVSLVLAGWVSSCAGDPELAGPYESCEVDEDCSDPLSCVDAICKDISNPQLNFLGPATLDAFDPGELVYTYLTLTYAHEGDYVEVSFDPESPTPATTLVAWPPEFAQSGAEGIFPAPMQPGPHWLRARVLDAEGQPYPNEFSRYEVLVFVRDPIIPDKPQLALLEPRPGYVHPLGTDLSFEAAVLPGSFVFTRYGAPCLPLPDCVDPFAPECQDECGPVSRTGILRAHLDIDLPGCVQMDPSCQFDYVGGYDEQVDAYVVRGTIAAEVFESAGEHTFALMLSHGYDPYPSEAAPIFVELPLRVE